MATTCDLVFEGGGAKGAVFVGALQELQRRGFQAGRLVGTSAGAITAVMLAAGYTADDMARIAQEKTADGKPRFSTFLDSPAVIPEGLLENSDINQLFNQISILDAIRNLGISIPGLLANFDARIRLGIINQILKLPRARALFSFVERGGLYEGTVFLNWVREKLNARGQHLGETTMADFHEATGRDVTVVASDTTGGEMLVLNHRTAPLCPTAWAVRMSMSIPFLWDEVLWEADWGSYRDRALTSHCVVDGGALSNFPLALLTDSGAPNSELMGNTNSGARVLGLLIDETIAVPGSDVDGSPVAASPEQALLNQLKTIQRVRRLVDTMSEAHDKQVIAEHKALVCRLPAQGYGTTEFDMSEGRMSALIAAGQNAMASYLSLNA